MDDSPVEKEIEEDEIFWFWETKEKIFEIYKIARFYLTEYYGLDSNIVIRLIDEQGISMSQGLYDIAFIHAGYSSIILEDIKTRDKSKTDFSTE